MHVIPTSHWTGLFLGNSAEGYQKFEYGFATACQSIKFNEASQPPDE
jgi:hypothetical protein